MNNVPPFPAPTLEVNIVGLIPARWASTRFPGKPLHLIAGKPLVQHVFDRASQCTHLKALAIATDDQRIADAAQAFGARVILTSPDHPSGTDRLAEAAVHFPKATHLINIQGDEPLINPAHIDHCANQLAKNPELEILTAACPISDAEQIADPNVVKVVFDKDHRALYFSRSPIPYRRNSTPALSIYRHIGLYGYRLDTLQKFISHPPSILEQAESLEQLRALENGIPIHLFITNEPAPGVDTLEQAQEVEALILNESRS